MFMLGPVVGAVLYLIFISFVKDDKEHKAEVERLLKEKREKRLDEADGRQHKEPGQARLKNDQKNNTVRIEQTSKASVGKKSGKLLRVLKETFIGETKVKKPHIHNNGKKKKNNKRVKARHRKK